VTSTISQRGTVAAPDLAALHACRSTPDLDGCLAAALRPLLAGIDFVICIATDDPAAERVAVAVGDGCPLRVGDQVARDAWQRLPARRVAIDYQGRPIGALVLGSDLVDAVRADVNALLQHYGIAFANLTLNQAALATTDNYCASLTALEEGIVLFQETEPAAVTARILALAAGMVHAQAGALYVLQQVGDVRSGLTLEQHLGMPEALLQGFRAADGAPWPDALLEQPALVAAPDADGGVVGLDPECVPPVLQQVVAVPLAYHGVVAGMCLLFNPGFEPAQARDHVSRLQTFGQLAAALLHRLQLEQQMAHSRSIARELEIAETIQKRSLPTQAPPSERFEFAWSLVAAQQIGGDCLDLLAGPDGEIHAVVADASGHGINSALLMSSFRSNYRVTAARLSLPQLAHSLNHEVVHEVGPTGMFITAALVRWRPDGNVTICSAGHCPTIVFRAASGQVEQWSADGPPFGFVDGAEYGSSQRQLAAGDVMLLYTDGASEATNAELDMFTEDRLAEVLRQHAGEPPDAILAAIRANVAKFTGRSRYDDDMSLLVAKVR
jgi:serine phosphatase RsbU (regulator of sigma subunit)